ncbi:MAG: DEAD/DEAH box helicase [Phycisphaerae bacterium]|nr:DEAD/DEAH box helicase [Phycisphaerae bacterium]
MDARSFIARLQAGRHYRGQIAAVRELPARAADFRQPTTPLPTTLQTLLAADGINALYRHQADAYDAIRAGRHVVIATGTASGKSLCYHLPVLATLLDDTSARALYLFPAKALAYDQLGSLERLIEQGGLAERARPACYDGDTATHKRPGVRRNANILLSNPDMLHQGILPYHAKWAGFFAGLRFVVLDEIHTYRGIFGSHVAGVVRRLQRVCRHYGASPQFICCSATLGNPRELAERLTGQSDLVLIDQDTSPRGRRWFVLWNPPWLEDRPPTPPRASLEPLARALSGPPVRVARRSANVEAQHLMQALLEEGAGTIAFTKARVVAELLYKYVSESLQRRRPDLARRLRPYRGGYLPLERREIERQLFSGELLGVCSTTALELGIDVGALDAALMVGFPGTLCSLWQQAGRAGRRQDESLAIFIAYDDPVDQYLMRNPDFVFDRPLEQAIIDPDNPHILAAQLGCAAFELPLSDDDLRDFGALAADVTQVLTEDGKLRRTAERLYWSSAEFPAAQTNLRTISNATFAIVDTTDGRDEVIGQVDSISAPELVYPEAVYLHQGESYIVRQLDQAARLARVERLAADYYTQPVLADECRLGTERFSGDCRGGKRCFGEVTVKWQTVAFRKFKLYTQELIGQTALDLPAQQVETTGLWLQPPEQALAATRDAGGRVHEALSGVRNLLMVALPPLAMCDRYDIGGIVNSSQLGVSTIIIYDRYEGGVGYARHGYERCAELLALAYRLVAGCGCSDGCPGCVAPPNLRIPIHHDPDVGRGYAIPDKTATVTLLKAWLGA